jgi:DNA repair exonuclease SbcCD ATPase subunit
LTNKSLYTIQGFCNLYLSKIHTDLQIKLEGFKTLSDGKTVKENITTIIFRDGGEEEDYKCFSGGEKDRLIFSTILTFQSLVNQKSKSGGLDLCVIDEVFGRTDALGMRLFIESLQELNRTVLLISQVQTNSEIVKPLIVSKENGWSIVK